MCPWSHLFSRLLPGVSLCFLSVMRWGNPAKCSFHSELLPMCMGPSNLGLNPFKLRARLKLSSFTWLKSGILMTAIKAWQILRPSIRKEYVSLSVFVSSGVTIIYCMSQGVLEIGCLGLIGHAHVHTHAHSHREPCMHAQFYYEGLAHVMMETKEFHSLQADDLGKPTGQL